MARGLTNCRQDPTARLRSLIAVAILSPGSLHREHGGQCGLSSADWAQKAMYALWKLAALHWPIKERNSCRDQLVRIDVHCCGITLLDDIDLALDVFENSANLAVGQRETALLSILAKSDPPETFPILHAFKYFAEAAAQPAI